MSDRSYFQFRYSVPGFTFILLIMLINYIPIIALIAEFNSAFVAFMAFLSLLSGSAIGFLVSQVWWVIHIQLDANYGWLRKPRKPIKTLQRKYGLAKPSCWQDKKKIVMIYDYILHSEIEKEHTGLFEYRKRRWDMYHVLSTEIITIILGIIIGFLLRFSLFSGIPLRKIEPYLLGLELWISLFTFLCGLGFVILLFIGRRFVMHRYDEIAEIFILRSKVQKSHLEDIFSHKYFANAKEVQR